MIAAQVDMSFYWWFLVGIVAGCALLCLLAVIVGVLGGLLTVLWDVIHGS